MTRLLMHGLGVAGYVLMAWSAFGYSWRKSVLVRPPMSAHAWLDMHIVTGALGAVLVVAHGGIGGLTLGTLTSALVVVVVASGAIGRYVYTATARQPRNELAEDLARLDSEIAVLEHTRESDRDEDGGGSGGTAVITRRAWTAAVEAELRALRGVQEEQQRRLRKAAALARRRRLLATWWVFHVPLAMAMLTLGLVHAIAVLWYSVA